MVRLPAPMPEHLTIIRNTYDADGRTGPLSQDLRALTLTPTTGDVLVYEIFQRIVLQPGRHQIRLNGSSRALDKSASVFADVEVPDFATRSVSTSTIVLGTRPPGGVERDDAPAPLLPILPTSAREFGTNETIVAFLRVFQGGESSLVPTTVSTQVFDIADKRILDTSATLGPDAFDASRSANVEVPLPLSGLTHGPHLLTMTVTKAGAAPVRRDLVFRVR